MKLYLTPKTLKKIIKMLVLFILACILIYYSSILNVNATSSTTSTDLGGITYPLAVSFKDYASGFPSLSFKSNYGYTDPYVNSYVNSSTVSMQTNGIIVSIPEVLTAGHSYILYNYWATSVDKMIWFGGAQDLGVGTYLTEYPNTSLEVNGHGRYPTYNQIITVASATSVNQYVDLPYLSVSYIQFTYNDTISGQRTLYFSQMAQSSQTYNANQLAYLGYRLIDTTTLTSGQKEQLNRIEDGINSLNLSDVESKLNQIQEEQKNTSDAIDEQIQQDKEQHEAEMEQDKQQHEETMDTITDTTAPDTSGLSNAAGWLPPGPVDSLVNLPINLLNSLLGNIGSTCNSINLTLPFVKKDFTIPCPTDLLNRLGDNFLTFWESMGLIAGCWCLYKYFINLYKWVESALTMDEKEQLGKWGGV